MRRRLSEDELRKHLRKVYSKQTLKQLFNAYMHHKIRHWEIEKYLSKHKMDISRYLQVKYDLDKHEEAMKVIDYELNKRKK